MSKEPKSKEATKRIRQRVEAAGVYFYQVADKLEITEVTLRRWLRNGCDRTHYDRIMEALDALEGGGPQ